MSNSNLQGKKKKKKKVLKIKFKEGEFPLCNWGEDFFQALHNSLKAKDRSGFYFLSLPFKETLT